MIEGDSEFSWPYETGFVGNLISLAFHIYKERSNRRLYASCVCQFGGKVVLNSELDSKSDSWEWKKKGMQKDWHVSSGCDVEEETE
jgi:hypothetical protein